jgi:hypothetical protein
MAVSVTEDYGGVQITRIDSKTISDLDGKTLEVRPILTSDKKKWCGDFCDKYHVIKGIDTLITALKEFDGNLPWGILGVRKHHTGKYLLSQIVNAGYIGTGIEFVPL